MADNIAVCYEVLGREPLGERRLRMRKQLEMWDDRSNPILSQFRKNQLDLLRHHKMLDFDIKDDERKLNNILTVLPKIISLESETYIRSFSEAVFSDSKQFLNRGYPLPLRRRRADKRYRSGELQPL